MNFNDLITKYPDESLRQAISDAYQVGYGEGVQAAAGSVISALSHLQGARSRIIAGTETMNDGDMIGIDWTYRHRVETNTGQPYTKYIYTLGEDK